MKRINFNIKDRKFLYGILCIVLVSVFTLTIAYAALNAVLTISGSARVSAADWDIYLSNPRVTSGSATPNVPIVNGVTATFNTTLNMPGDFYEFVVDVVNGGDIDAMIENVVKTPELTADQAKFLKYEITYQNGESIANKQLLSKDTTVPIKVRIEYRKDLSNTDLPTGQVVLDLSLTLEYTQSDGTASAVTNNGQVKPVANGSIEDIGTIVTIGSEQFYTIGTEDDSVKLLSMYNLYVGNIVDENQNVSSLKNPTGMQNELAKGYIHGEYPIVGTTAFSDIGDEYVGSIVEGYVNSYKNIIEANFGVEVVEARLITTDELFSEEIGCVNHHFCTDAPSFITLTTYWTGTAYKDNIINYVARGGMLVNMSYYKDNLIGVRPVIIISKDYFN